MLKIKTLNNISTVGLDKMPKNKYQIGNNIGDPDAILVRSAKIGNMSIGANLKAVGRAGVGVNNIPLDKMSARGVVVFNAPGANANAVKELMVASMLLASRNICQAWMFVNKLNIDNLAAQVEIGKKQYSGSELPNKTLGIIGLGAVGVACANAAHALGMQVIGFDPSISVKSAWRLSAGVEQALSLDELCARSDFVSLHVPLSDKTANLLSADKIVKLPTGATVLNFARDSIVDEAALKPALDSGRINYYVTDFPIDEMKNHPRVIALPHLGASTVEAEDNCAIMVVKQIKDYLENGNINNSVNFPEANMPKTEAIRLAINHQNILNMVGQISNIIASANINIVDLLNKSRDSVAYTIIDLETDISADTFSKIAAIDGVLIIRKL